MHCKTIAAALITAGCLTHTASAVTSDLMDIYKEAFLKDPVILQSKANRDEAFEAIDEATAALLPQIDIVGSISATTTTVLGTNTDSTSTSGGIDLTQALWRHSAWVSRSIAEKTAAQQDLVYNEALQNLMIRVADAYFGVLNAEDTLIFARANQEALRTQLNEATRRFQVGLIAETDQLEAQAAYDLSTAQVIEAENSLINSYEEIRLLIGRPVTDIAKLDSERFSPASIDRERQAILQSAEMNNLGLQAAIVARDIAKDDILLAKTGHEPTLDLVGSWSTGYNTYTPDNESSGYVDGNTHGGTIGVQLNLPLFHGGATSSQVAQAEQRYVAASEALELSHRTVVSNINNGYNNVNANISSVRAYEQTVKSAASALAATQAGYEVGTRTMSDVLDATQSYYSAQQNLSAARFNYILSRLNLLYNEGVLQVKDIEAVNRGLTK